MCYPAVMRVTIIFPFCSSVVFYLLPIVYPHMDPRLALDGLWFMFGMLAMSVISYVVEKAAKPAVTKPKPSGVVTPAKPPFLKPTVTLKQLVADVQRALDREQSDKRVDLEIADKIHQDNLAVWGRVGDNAQSKMTADQLRHARINVIDEVIEARNDWGKGYTFTDIMFDRTEVEGVWGK